MAALLRDPLADPADMLLCSPIEDRLRAELLNAASKADNPHVARLYRILANSPHGELSADLDYIAAECERRMIERSIPFKPVEA